MKFEGISTLILRIDIPDFDGRNKEFEHEIVETIESDWELQEADVSGNVLTCSGPLEDEIWVRHCQAKHWRHNFGMRLTEDEAMFLQAGSKASERDHEVRIIFDDFSKYQYRYPESLMRLCGDQNGFGAWGVTVEELRATYALKGLGLNDLGVKFVGFSDRAIDRMVSTCGKACGYQAGRRLNDDHWSTLTTQDGGQLQVKKRFDWTQGRRGWRASGCAN